MVDKVASSKSGAWFGAGGSITEPHGAGLLSWLVLRLWLGKTGGSAFLPLSECVPPPTMRAAALSHLLSVAGWLCRAAGGCRWADDSAKLRSLAAAGFPSVSGLRCARWRLPLASGRIRCRLPHNAANPHAAGREGLDILAL